MTFEKTALAGKCISAWFGEPPALCLEYALRDTGKFCFQLQILSRIYWMCTCTQVQQCQEFLQEYNLHKNRGMNMQQREGWSDPTVNMYY